MSAWTINGFDPATLGFTHEHIEGWRSSLNLRRATTDVPGRFGRIRMGKEAEAEPRRLVIDGWMRAGDVATLQANLHELKHRLYDGLIAVTFADAPDLVFYGVTEFVEVIPIRPALTQKVHRLRISIECDDPRAFEVTPTQVVFTTGRAAIPIGTGVSEPVLRVSGAASDFTITYRNARGEPISEMEFDIDLSAGQYIDIDCANMQVTDQAGASQVATMAEDSEFIVFDPYDADVDGTALPTIEISPTPALAVATYVKTYI